MELRHRDLGERASVLVGRDADSHRIPVHCRTVTQLARVLRCEKVHTGHGRHGLKLLKAS